ncbi:TonB-dependent receptor plug domain-containing protein [Alteromonas gilva]|uniref:TonB-dependent receptor n=1 Tax=Alteromonas gilva TaxID=2987522 RepID=A0ABT5L202_9ALTE|nr:TonB-dependent receptor [Alteromonas gilva]MDC8831074.1 TonB-dependent receptor [Alteromonas gilva]
MSGSHHELQLLLRVVALLGVMVSPVLFAQSPDETLRIKVTERAPDALSNVLKIQPSQQIFTETSFSNNSLATLLSDAPAINLNGQGGLFQTISIRGYSRWRMSTQVEGIPIHTDRRAGTAVEFLPPDMVGRASLITGAASTQLGSGAIGGGINFALATPRQSTLDVNYGLRNDYREVAFYGTDDSQSWSWLFNHRHANNSTDANRHPITDQFEQQAFALRKTDHHGTVKDALILYSTSNNIAKASADDPQTRTTLYPNNDHLLGKVEFNWHNATLYVHDAALTTVVSRPGKRVNYIQNEARTLGAQLNDAMPLGDWLLLWRAGVDGRLDVNVQEQERDNNNALVFARANLRADQWESFVAADISKQITTGTLAAGARLAHMYQRDKLSGHTQSDHNLSAFIGYKHAITEQWYASAYVSNGFRVPSLTERFYNGSTPRGTTEGATDLRTERARNAEGSLIYETPDSTVSFTVFSQHINNYIERVTVNDELRRYQNLGAARIDGINYQASHSIDWARSHWQLRVGGQWLSGKDNNGQAIADIAPAQHRMSLTWFGSQSQAFIALTHRQSSHDKVPGEQPTTSIDVVDAGYQYRINDSLEMSLNLTNLTNANYVTSRDDLAPFATGRDMTLSITAYL